MYCQYQYQYKFQKRIAVPIPIIFLVLLKQYQYFDRSVFNINPAVSQHKEIILLW